MNWREPSQLVIVSGATAHFRETIALGGSCGNDDLSGPFSRMSDFPDYGCPWFDQPDHPLLAAVCQMCHRFPSTPTTNVSSLPSPLA